MFLLKVLIFVTSLGIVLLLLSRLITAAYSNSRIFEPSEVPESHVAIVFGAGLTRDGNPTAILKDRVKTAVDLYDSGKVKILLMSGDNRTVNYNEPAAMFNYALQLGVPESAIVLDYAGRRTYDTCYRAGQIFGLDRAIVVTQSFHMPRVIYTCNNLDVDANGVIANNRSYRRGSLIYWNIRESLATLFALWDVHIGHPLPVLGDSEPIPNE